MFEPVMCEVDCWCCDMNSCKMKIKLNKNRLIHMNTCICCGVTLSEPLSSQSFTFEILFVFFKLKNNQQMKLFFCFPIRKKTKFIAMNSPSL